MGSKSPDDAIRPDPFPDLVVERGPDGTGVGSWVPAKKHRLLCEYLYGTRHAWKKWATRVYIDPFCGPGRIQVKGETITREGGAVRAWHALKDSAPFTKVFIGDLDGDRVEACRRRLEACDADVTPFPGKAAETVPKMVAAVPRGALCMAFIDPYNLELLSYPMLETLANLQVDLAINFSTMDLTRNVEIEFDAQGGRFDAVAPGWSSDRRIKEASRSNRWLAFFNYWFDLVKTLKFENSKEMPIIHNDQGSPMYRMVFFARHAFPNRIWSDVARGPTPDLFS